MESVISDIIAASTLPDWDKEAVASAVDAAIKTWWEKDKDYEVIAVELYGERPFRYKIDLVLQDRNGLVVVDWKTKTSGKLDERWVYREKHSYQPKLYVAALSRILGRRIFPVRYEVRGVTIGERPQVAMIPMLLTHEDALTAVRNLASINRQRKALGKRYPWTRNPSGCECFGPMYACEFGAFCWERGAVVPEGTDGNAPLSHTSASEFLRCPERYRLLRVLGKIEDEEGPHVAGIVFHRAMEVLYCQKLKQEDSILLSEKRRD